MSMEAALRVVGRYYVVYKLVGIGAFIAW